MKLHELFNQPLLESTVTLPHDVTSLKEFIDPKTGKYYTGVVNVEGSVMVAFLELISFPVTFGKIGGDFGCDHNKLTSLKGAPQKIVGEFSCTNNRLSSFEGAPQEIGDRSYYYENKITSLEGIHKLVKTIGKSIDLSENPIKSGGIGLILIEGLTRIIADQPAFEIIEKYLGQGKKGLLRCQDELIDAGFEEFARL